MTDNTSLMLKPATDLLAPSEAASTLLMLEALPHDGLTDQQLAQVKQIACAPLPDLPQTGEKAFAEALAMLDTLPRRKDDTEMGELRVRVYRRCLGHLPSPQLWWTIEEAIKRCKFCPSVKEILDIACEWTRRDHAVQAHRLADRLYRNELHRRHYESLPKPPAPPPLTQEMVDAMSPELIRMGLTCKALIRDADGKVIVNPE